MAREGDRPGRPAADRAASSRLRARPDPPSRPRVGGRGPGPLGWRCGSLLCSGPLSSPLCPTDQTPTTHATHSAGSPPPSTLPALAPSGPPPAPSTPLRQLSLAFSRNPLHPPPLLKRLLPTNKQNARLTLSYNSADILPALPQAPGVPPLSHRLSPLPEAGARLPHHAHPTSHWIPANIHPPSTHPFAFLPQVLPQDFKGTNTTLSPFAQNHHHHKAQRTNRPKNQPKENKQTNTALSPVSWSSPDTLTALPQARGVPQHSLLLSPLPHQASGAPPPSTLPPLTPSPPLPAIFPQLFQGTLSTLCPFSKTLLPGSCQLQLHWQPDLSPTAPASVPQQSLPLSSLPHARTPTPTTQARRAPPPSTLPALTPSPPPLS